MELDRELLARARKACGAKTDTETVRRGLMELLRRQAIEDLISLGGTMPDLQDVPRRRIISAKRAAAR